MILSSAQFVGDFVPPDYVLEGVLQRRFIYALTGKTGSGKTAILLRLAAHVALGRPIGKRAVEKGRVLYFAGENADDVRMRWIAMAQQLKFGLDVIDVYFIPGVFKISQMQARISAEIEKIGGNFTLIIVDTSAAYFEGDDENSNVQHGQHARLLRSLTKMPGEPCVVVACHPVKNANDDNLIPRGGGSFLNEIDGNLTAKTNAAGAEVHWLRKLRGSDFAPIRFQLRTVTHERLMDSKGRLIPTVVASPLSEEAQEHIAKNMRRREDEMLVALLDPANRTASQAELARRLGWKMRNGDPYQVLVSRVLTALQRNKLIAIKRDVITLTKTGEKAAQEAKQALFKSV